MIEIQIPNIWRMLNIYFWPYSGSVRNWIISILLYEFNEIYMYRHYIICSTQFWFFPLFHFESWGLNKIGLMKGLELHNDFWKELFILIKTRMYEIKIPLRAHFYNHYDKYDSTAAVSVHNMSYFMLVTFHPLFLSAK